MENELQNVNVFITNLGRYNEGYLVGRWVTLPVEDIWKTVHDAAKLDETHEEFFVTDWETPDWMPDGLIGEYPDIELLNAVCALADANDAAIYAPAIRAVLDNEGSVTLVDVANAVRAAGHGELPFYGYDMPWGYNNQNTSSDEERFALTMANLDGVYEKMVRLGEELHLPLEDSIDWASLYESHAQGVTLYDDGWLDCCVDWPRWYGSRDEVIEDAEDVL